MGLFKDLGSAFVGNAILGPLGGISGGGALGADILTGGAVSNAKSVSETNNSQMALANQQMAFQERMSNTAYERAMADMRRSGLNPMLAFERGGASTPSGAMATLTAPRKGDIGAGLFNTAKAVVSKGADLQQVYSQTDLNKAQAVNSEASAEKLTANAKESQENTEYTRQLREKAKADTKKAKLEARKTELDLGVSEARRPVDQKLAPMDAYLDRIEQIFGTVGSGMRSLFRGREGRGGAGRAPMTRKQETKALERAGSKGIPIP